MVAVDVDGRPAGLSPAADDPRTAGGLPAGPKAGRADRRGTPLGRQLVLLVGAVALPLLILGTATVCAVFAIERKRTEGQLVLHAQRMVRLIDQEFERAEGIAIGLASSSALARGDLRAFEDELRDATGRLDKDLAEGERTEVVLFDASGRRLLGTAPGSRTGDESVPAPGYVREAMEAAQSRNSDLLPATPDGPPRTAIAVPVLARTPDADGRRRPMGAIAVTVERSRLLRVVAGVPLPPGVHASVQDRQGITVARSFRDAETVGRLPMPAVLSAMRVSESGLAPRGTRTLDGEVSTIAFARAPRSGFFLKADVPEQVLLAPVRSSLLKAAAIGLAVLAGGIGLALLLARRIVGAFRRVPSAAVLAVVSGQAPASTGLREADSLAGTLARTIAERDEANASIRTLFETSPVGVIISDTGGRVHEANDAFLRIVGRTRAELEAGKILWDEITPDEWIGSDEVAIGEAVAAGRCVPYEKEYLRPDGSRVPVLLSFGLTNRRTGRAAVFVVDLTERYRAEAELRESEERLRLAQEIGGIGAWELDFRTGERRWSPGTYSLWGLSPDTRLTADLLLGMIHEQDRERAEAALQNALFLKGPPTDLEFRIRRASDGAVRWLSSRSEIATRDPWTGRPRRQVGIMRDVTARRMAEAALRESEDRLRAITDAMPQMVWSARPDGYHDYFNQRWYDLTGTSPDQVAEEGWKAIFHPDDWERASARWRYSLETGEPYEIEYRLRMADGSYRWMLGRALPIRDAETAGIIRWFGTCTDIEETVSARQALSRSREELEELVETRTRELRTTQARLVQAQRMEALGQLAGGIAHDLNNVLQVVQGGAALLERRPGDEAGVRRLARLVMEATERGAAVTHRLLAFSRQSDLTTETVEPARLLASLQEILVHTLGVGVRVELDLAPDLPPLLADKAELETVLVNLATNARDAMSGSGTLTFSAAVEGLPTGTLAFAEGAAPGSQYLRISVSDTGSGMDAATLSRVTEPFFTTKEIGKGTGLGLAMVRGFAEQSGGGLHIESEPGQGTVVNLWFPLATPAPDVTDSVHEAGAQAKQSARVLLVDDDMPVRSVLTAGLRALGFDVVDAQSGEAALEILSASEAFDLVISDLSMPRMDGVTLLREVRSRVPGLPAILLTGYVTDVAGLAAGEVVGGGVSVLRKPIRVRELAECVSALLESRYGRT